MKPAYIPILLASLALSAQGRVRVPIEPRPRPVPMPIDRAPMPIERAPRPRPMPVPDRDPRPAARVHPGTGAPVFGARCTTFPTETYWRTRDLSAEIQDMARRGVITVTPVPHDALSLTDFTDHPAGWKAYGIAMPPGGKVAVEVKHHKLAWFRLMAVAADGRPGAGMLQSMSIYRPVAFTVENPHKEARAVYIIVDDPAWWSDKESPYTLEVKRDWDPARVDLASVKMVVGIWGASPSVSAQFAGPSLTGPAVFPH